MEFCGLLSALVALGLGASRICLTTRGQKMALPPGRFLPGGSDQLHKMKSCCTRFTTP
jgi:hypothetical protein